MIPLHRLYPLLLLFHPITAAELIYSLCEGGNYTTNSAFQSNLELLLTSLSNSSTTSTFSNITKGSNPDRAYGLFLCRGDVSPSTCHDCIQTATHSILQTCLYSKQVTVWYDTCQLRYSDESFFSSFGNAQYINYPPGGPNVTNSPALFSKYERELMSNLSNLAAYNSSPMFATGKLSYGGDDESVVIYGLVQCTRDLSRDSCSRCLNEILGFFWKCCDSQMEGGILGKSCNFKYEDGRQFFEGVPDISFIVLPPSAPAPSASLSPPPPSNTIGEDNSKGNRNIIISIVISVAVAFLLTLAVFMLFRRRSAINMRRRSAMNSRGVANPEEISSTESLYFDLFVLKIATANFSDINKLGQGGFGAVYKGTLPNGQDIAVKRLSTNSKQGIEELKNELMLFAKLQHRNLVRLRGVCLEEGEKLLVYEYMPNGSLDRFLFDPIKCKELDWEKRFKIIGGIARGLLYLHEESHMKVIHRDLKASNVLLDANMKPKIADFGLARLFGGDETHGITSRVVGTFGYMAPEYARRGQFSTKLDVYSYGILVLEIVMGRKNSTFKYDSQRGQDVLSYTWMHWRNGTTLEIIDPSLGESYSRNEVLRCIQIALLCAQEFAANRPSMSSVFLMLNSPSMLLMEPVLPTFLAGLSMVDSDISSSSSLSKQSYFGCADMSSTSSMGSSQQSGSSVTPSRPETKHKGKEMIHGDIKSNQAFNSRSTQALPSRLSQTTPAGRTNRD